jgi:hypothetical protein
MQQVRRFGAVNRELQSPFARRDGDLPLPKLFTGAILASKPPGIWRMSGKTAAAGNPEGGRTCE